MEASEIVNRVAALESQRKTLDNTYQVIEKFVRPFSGEFFKPLNSESEVDWRRRGIYDSTAIIACDLLAGQIHANLVSPSVKWFDFQYRDTDVQKDMEAQQWLDDLEEETWKTLSESDFNLQVAEFLTDICSFGTAIMFEEEVDEMEWKGIDFSALPVRDCYHEPDAKDGLLRVYRRLQYTSLQLMDRFEMPQEWLDKYADDKDVEVKWTVWFAVYPREDIRKDYEKKKIKPKQLAPKVRPWGYKYILEEGLLDLEEGGYYKMPAFRTMWKKTSGSRNGHSPAFICLSDVLQLNEVVKQSSEARAKAIDPAMITTERGVIGDVDLEPGGLTTVTDMDQLQVLESKARFDVQNEEVYRLQTSIRSVFFIDKLELKESPAMTATEVNVRYERMMRQFASTLGRLQSDFLDKLLQLTISIIMRHNIMREPPDGVGEFDIVYTGPIPRAQQAEIANSIAQYLADLASLAEIYPEMLDRVDPDKAALELQKVRGAPSKIMRTDKEVQVIRTARADEQRKIREAQLLQQQGAAMEQAGKGAAAVGEVGDEQQ